MNSARAFLITLAVLGASAKPQASNSFQCNSFKIVKAGCGSSAPSAKTHIRTSVAENPTLTFPSFIPPATVSQSCHCLRTIVLPQVFNEIITVPTVDGILRTVAAPVVETVESGPLGTFTQKSISSGVSGNRNLGGVFQNDISTSGGSNNGLCGGENARIFFTRHNSNSANGGPLNKSNGVSGNVINQPPISAFLSVNGKNHLGSTSAIFSGNAGYLNNDRVFGF